MNYLIINNDYHYGDLIRYFPENFIDNCKFISIPVNLKNPDCIDKSKLILPNYSLKKNLINPLYAYKIRNKILKSIDSLKLTSFDSLFTFTEIELSNQIVIEYFFKFGASIYLVEDGTASALLYNKNLKANNLFAKTIQFYLYWFCNLKNTTVLNYRKGYFYFLPDYYFSGFIQFNQFKIERKINRFTLDPKEPPFKFNGTTNSCIFFNQNFYIVYLSLDDFLDILETTIGKLCATFTIVYFKFHPNEREIDKLKIKNRIKYSNIFYLADSVKVNYQLDVKFGVSFISTALREYNFYGLRPIYLFHLFQNLIPHDLSSEYKLYLQSMNYIFLEDLELLSTYCELESFFSSSINGKDESTIFPFKFISND
jgi:hypothetical protein